MESAVARVALYRLTQPRPDLLPMTERLTQITQTSHDGGRWSQPDSGDQVVLSCATAMGAGTLSGGWRIIKTLGTRIIDLPPINGFAAETAASTVLATASSFGMPVSTTHIVCGSGFGFGVAKRLNEVHWTTAQRMVSAWVMTLPGAALVAGLSFFLISLVGHHVPALALR